MSVCVAANNQRLELESELELELEAAEVVFAQKLASGEPHIRKRALTRLQSWIASSSAKGTGFTQEDFLKLWKGLYYCMWMQDKMLVQEELAENISGLIDHISTDAQVDLFVETFFVTLAREWHGIDRWRLDKFLMFVRRLVRKHFSYLKSRSFDKSATKRAFSVWNRTVLSDDATMPDGLKFHFASVYLDELDLCGGDCLTSGQVTRMLQPFITLLGKSAISDYLFSSVLEEVFVCILHQFSDELADQQGNDGNTSEENENLGNNVGEGGVKGIQFDYASIAQLLFAVGKARSAASDRRRRIYDVVKRFKLAASGEDPMHSEYDSGSDSDDELQVAKAAQKLMRRDQEMQLETERFRKSKRKGKEGLAQGNDSDGEVSDEGEALPARKTAPLDSPSNAKKRKVGKVKGGARKPSKKRTALKKKRRTVKK